MKNIRILYFGLLLMLSGNYLLAQQSAKAEMISISVQIPDEEHFESESLKQLLKSKLDKALSLNGVGGKDNGYSQFILYPSVDYVSHEMTAGAPTMFISVVDLSIFVGTKDKGKTFSSFSVSLKGVGKSKELAKQNAFRSLSGRNKKFIDMLQEANDEILSFYKSNCSSFILEAKSMRSIGDYAEAISLLYGFPLFDSECFQESRELMYEIHKDLEDIQCDNYIQKASIALAQREPNKAAFFLLHISPLNTCQEEISSAISKLEALKEKIKDEKLDLLIQLHSFKTAIAISKIESRTRVAEAFYTYLAKVNEKKNTNNIIVIK